MKTWTQRGGASVTLQLLSTDMVDQIGLADVDPWIASFWQVLFFDTAWLVEQIQSIEISLATWRRFKASQPENDRDRALTCLFLNRTSFHGILADAAGPMGGKKQQSPYPIDCRFTRKTIVKRVEQIAAYRDRVAFVICADWKATILQSLDYRDKEILFYFDPPFFHKANALYRKWFQDTNHVQLYNFLRNFKGNWLLSYDDTERFKELYVDMPFSIMDIQVLYSLSTRSGRNMRSEVLVTNLL